MKVSRRAGEVLSTNWLEAKMIQTLISSNEFVYGEPLSAPWLLYPSPISYTWDRLAKSGRRYFSASVLCNV